MTLHQQLFQISSWSTAFFALAAAVYWFLSSRPTPPPPKNIEASVSDVTEHYAQSAIADIYSIHSVMIQASRLDRWASIFSGLSAVFGAMTAFLST